MGATAVVYKEWKAAVLLREAVATLILIQQISALTLLTMAPAATATAQKPEEAHGKTVPIKESLAVQNPQLQEEELPKVLTGHKEPLKLSGALDKYEHFDSTPIIGREFPSLDIKELLRAPNSDDLIRDLAITSRYIFHPKVLVLIL